MTTGKSIPSVSVTYAQNGARYLLYQRIGRLRKVSQIDE